MKTYLAFCGTVIWRIEAASLPEARTLALEAAEAELKHRGLMPLAADEIRVRPAREDELVGV